MGTPSCSSLPAAVWVGQRGCCRLMQLPSPQKDSAPQPKQRVQLQLSAESVGEVYIKSTETGQYLAMDTDGLLYGSLNKFTAALDSTVWMYHSPRNQSPFYGYLDTKRGMFVPGKAGGKPLQHLHIQEACREELVRWSQEEWELQTRSSDSLWAESNLVSSPARLL
ncbi:fibroblast growth factor 1 isoform X2 [Equus przewalskii]|uniref:Fibroblast growth factor 1 isoform X2 n=1 Tax=Equus przewalskii TaxID=9798 RepID=A0ABM4KEJ1_EQUPR